MPRRRYANHTTSLSITRGAGIVEKNSKKREEVEEGKILGYAIELLDANFEELGSGGNSMMYLLTCGS